MPALRFKDKNGQAFEAPDELTIQDLFDKVKTTNKDGANKNVITNSAEHGLIPQREFFDKDIAVEGNTSKYTIIKDGDFVYNPRKSSTAPYGPFNCYTREEPGIVSPLYSCLTPKNKAYTPYLLYYFASPAWYSYIYHNGNQGGARHDRVGMTDDLLQGIPVLLPCQEEQDKITAFLSLYDKRIAAQASKVEALETRRKGLLQQIFSQEIRFKADDGSEFPEWDSVIIEDAFDSISDKNHPDKTVLTIIQGQGTIPRNESDRNISYNKASIPTYKLVKENDFIMHLRSFEGGLEIATREGIVSPAYTILRSKVELVPEFYRYYFRSSSFIVEKLTGITEGIRDGRSINMDDFWLLEIPYPSIPEQRKIGRFMDLINRQIQIEKDKLEAIKLVKKGLLQQMFV
jgi:type I restriction enzyme S subunit